MKRHEISNSVGCRMQGWGRWLLLTACVASVLSAAARPITRQQAQQRAAQFMKQQGDSRQLVPVTNVKRLAPRNFASVTASDAYYVFDRGTNEGFVIISGDDQTEPVLGYTDNGSFCYVEMPPNMREWLDGYARQITAIQSGANVVADAIPTHPKVPQMMKSKWSQGSPYNNACPYDAGSRSVTGCVATAMAQLLYYNREKSVTETQADMPAYETWTNGLQVAGIPKGSAIDWEHMKDEYGSSTDIEKKAVADLMHYCGVGAKMDYTKSSSGAQSWDAYQAIIKYFGYGSSTRFVDYTTVTSDIDWDQIVYNEMAAGRPIYISGANDGGGHAFVADGYDGNLKYHINWGWGGMSDGYYLLTNLTPGQQGTGGSESGYNAYRQIIIGLEPENYGEKTMTISDATVKKICLANFDADKNGKFTYAEAAAVTSLGEAFKGQTTIKNFNELYYFTSLTTLDDDAFNGCSIMTSVRLPKTMQKIGARAFMGCEKLKQIELTSKISVIGEEAFSGCKALAAPTLPEALKAIEDGTFRDCVAMTEVELPIGIMQLGKEAFAGCISLKTLSVTTFRPAEIQMGASVFEGIDLALATLNIMQGTKPYFTTAEQWKAFGKIVEQRELSGGLFADLTEGETYYIYNVGTGRYLSKGEAYGTQAVVNASPMRFVVNHNTTMPDGVYYLTSEDTGKAGRFLFRTTEDGNVGKGIQASFVDGTGLSAKAYWQVKRVADKVYTFQIPADEDGFTEGKYWGIQTDHASNAASPTYGVYADIDYASHARNCQWQLVRYDAEATARYQVAQTLGNLLMLAKKQKLKTTRHQAVYDNLESTLDELLEAQHSLRRQLGFIDFTVAAVRDACVSMYDVNSDGEVSYDEALMVKDFTVSFQGNSNITSFDEFVYFQNVPYLYGNTFADCVNLESVVLPKNLNKIYYRAFYGCKKLASVNIPEYVNNIGQNAFSNCTSLRHVTVSCPDPSKITLGVNVFSGVNLAACTLYVPFGAKDAYSRATTWKNFGNIVEVRGRIQPVASPVIADKAGLIRHVGTGKYLGKGEAYGTQSIVSPEGMIYFFKRTKSMPEGVYYLHSEQTGATGKALFRVSTDSKVGEGVKACFVDGALSDKAYWKVDSIAPNTYTLQVPSGGEGYVATEYLGVKEDHASGVASPTYGVYWDIKSKAKQSQWAFVMLEDYQAAERINDEAELLKAVLDQATRLQLDVKDEQAVYDRATSTDIELHKAYVAVRSKLGFITFTDSKVRETCLAQWDADEDGELSFAEAAAVKTIGEVFRGNQDVKQFEELRYFTSLTEIPENAFRGASALQTISLPAGVGVIGSGAFYNCNLLRYMVVFNDSQLLARGNSNISTMATLFVPKSMLSQYKADEDWTAVNLVTEYTGCPVVSAEGTRLYGRNFGTITVKVTGAPIMGTPETVSDELTVATTPVGTYPIQVLPGTVSTPDVTFAEGKLIIEPAPLTITAKSYTRNIGEANPVFEYTCKGFRNRETDSVFVSLPVITCEATADSPAGIYEITVSGGEAQNYALTYVSGQLTVIDPDGIRSVTTVTPSTKRFFDLQGRPVTGSSHRGIRIQQGGGKKILSR